MDDDQGSDQKDEPERDQVPTFTTRPTFSSSSSDGETMWVFDTPEQRLQRREEEKLQRKRAFRVLDDYNIKRVGSATAPTSEADFGLSPARKQPDDQGSQHGTKGEPLLEHNASSWEEQVVVHIPDATDSISLDNIASARVDDDYSDGYDSEYPSSLESGNAHSHAGPALPYTRRAYLVTEKPQTLLRRVSTSASAFAAWALNYDPKASY
ncbi:unnamed protein product [Phytophthora fragariaefolia]|uniref:Unnamed protein product n=1 Tax=Phytophthora fragariaefolia TaxID=1490495 RepID=A0A9W7CTW9_9STRA|nr:unnamed protein product [Phytophthora fragariaefolia]